MAAAAAAEVPPLSFVVFRSPLCEERMEMGARSLMAKSKMQPGALVLLEHCATFPAKSMHAAIKHDKCAYDTLWPREDTTMTTSGSSSWDSVKDRGSKEVDQLVWSKLESNTIDLFGDTGNGVLSPIGAAQRVVSLGLGFSAVNHASPEANCTMKIIRLTETPMKQIPLVFVCMVCKRVVMAGEELTVSYALGANPGHPFIAQMSEAEIHREHAIDDEALQQCGRMPYRAIEQYLESKRDVWKDVCCRQKLVMDGVFVAESNYMIMTKACFNKVTPEFRELLVKQAVESGAQLIHTAAGGGEGKEEGKQDDEDRNRHAMEMHCIYRWLWACAMEAMREFRFRKEGELEQVAQ